MEKRKNATYAELPIPQFSQHIKHFDVSDLVIRRITFFIKSNCLLLILFVELYNLNV